MACFKRLAPLFANPGASYSTPARLVQLKHKGLSCPHDLESVSSTWVLPKIGDPFKSWFNYAESKTCSTPTMKQACPFLFIKVTHRPNPYQETEILVNLSLPQQGLGRRPVNLISTTIHQTASFWFSFEGVPRSSCLNIWVCVFF